jgi:hypothetical protein
MAYYKTTFNIKVKNIPTLQSLEAKNQKEIGAILWDSVDNKKEFEELYSKSGMSVLPIIINSEDIKIHKLPWELLYHKKYGFLSINKKFTLTRHISSIGKTNNTPKQEPLKILFFSTLPDDLSKKETNNASAVAFEFESKIS